MEGNFDIKNLTPEQLNAALACKTTEELIAFAGKNGIKLTEEQAEKYLAQMTEMDVDLSAGLKFQFTERLGTEFTFGTFLNYRPDNESEDYRDIYGSVSVNYDF